MGNENKGDDRGGRHLRRGKSDSRRDKKSDASRRDKKSASRDKSAIGVRRIVGQKGFELVLPPCARARQEDIEEVLSMLEHGEHEIARDELVWLLEGCHELLMAHRLLGEIAAADNDLPLARGHFGYAYELGMKAVREQSGPIELPYSQENNRPFLESAKGLAWALFGLGKRELAVAVLDKLLELDPADPLDAHAMLARWRSDQATGNP